MNADGQLTSRELAKLVPAPDYSQNYRDIAGLPPDTKLEVGDFVRLVAYNEPSWIDSLWNSAQRNAEEHTEQVMQTFTDHGVTTVLYQVTGVVVADRNDDYRECYVYDLEIVGFTEPPLSGDGVLQQGISPRQLIVLGAELVALATLATAVSFQYIPGKGGIPQKIANGVFWLSLAAIAVSAAIIYKSAKAATP